MQDHRSETCCFSGYRIEKMPFRADDLSAVQALEAALDRAVHAMRRRAAIRAFCPACPPGLICGRPRPCCAHGRSCLCSCCALCRSTSRPTAIPPDWKRRFNHCLLAADRVYALSRQYYAGCYAARNRFMVDASSLLICYFDGRRGGTAQTVRMAGQSGLEIVNLANCSCTCSETAHAGSKTPARLLAGWFFDC